MVDERVAEALQTHAAPVTAASSGTGSSTSPAPLGRSLDGARIVGLGEATHGTRECFEHKRRLIEYLVAERNVRTVAFEADAAGVTVLDAYVRAGSDVVDVPPDPESALAELDMWQWRTESVRELLDWLRAFNDSRAPADQVRVRGVSLSTPSAPAGPLRTYLRRVDAGAAECEALETVAGAGVPDDAEERERVLAAVSGAAADLAGRLEANRGSYEAVSSATAWHTARHLCRVVGQACEWGRVRHQQPGPHPDGMASRDRFMAENALWSLERDAGTGVALWAHDGHVQRGTFDDGTPWAGATTMGERLARELGDGYRSVGFDFARGSFRAVGAGSGEVETFTVGDPLDVSATAAFAGVDDEPFLLDLGAAGDDERLTPWVTADRRKRHVGSVFDPEGAEGESYARTDLPASFDWLLFLPESTPTRPVDDG